MDAGDVFLVAFAGAMAFLTINGSYLFGRAGRQRLLGVDRRDPAASPPPAVVARLTRRGREAVRWSAALIAITGTLLLLTKAPLSSFLTPLILSAAVTGTTAALAVVGAGDAFRDRTPGPRVSRGRATTLADYSPPWLWALVLAVYAAFLWLAIPGAWASRPDARGWLAASVAGGASTVGFLGLALWAAGQPQAAASEVDLRWDDQFRSETLNALAILGPLLVLTFFGVARGSSTTGDGLLWAFMASVVVLLVIAFVGGPRLCVRRLWSGATVTVSRPGQGRSADARR
jgi:hypothetical protein